MGYHTRPIKKGVYGDFSKVEEEWEELIDARAQGARVLELCEITDLYGAIKGYVEKRFGMTIEDVATMSRMTSEAFAEGSRVSKKEPDVYVGPTGVYIADLKPIEIDNQLRCSTCGAVDDKDFYVSKRSDGLLHCHMCWFSNPRNRSQRA